jgi:hypothetical protein
VTRAALFCERCGTEGWRYRHGLCGPCALTVELRTVLDDGTDQVRPELEPFAEGVARMRNPRAGISWMARPHVHTMLRQLADPATPITHETLDAMTPWRSAAYLRDLLMLHGVLPPADRHLILFGRWLRDLLEHVEDPDHRKTVERFAVWHVQRRLRRFADHGPVTGKQTQQARNEIRRAAEFLVWLRDRGRTLSDCRQADIDAWYCGTYTARRLTHAFLRWAMKSKLLAPVHIPHQDTRNPAPLSQRQRLDVIRRLVTAATMEPSIRIAALFMLLYAQPLTRVLRLTIDDVLIVDGEVSIRLGEPPSPVPEPVAALLLDHIGHRLNLTTADIRSRRWADARPRSVTSSCKHRPRWSPACSATPRTKPPASPPRPAPPGAATDRKPDRDQGEYTTVDYARSPVFRNTFPHPHARFAESFDRHPYRRSVTTLPLLRLRLIAEPTIHPPRTPARPSRCPRATPRRTARVR